MQDGSAAASADPFFMLRFERDAVARLEYELDQRREARDRIAP